MTDIADILKAADADAAKRAKGEEVAERMLSVLIADGGWLTRAQLVERMWQTETREISLGREFSGGRIIYGQRGLKASQCATRDELQGCANQVRAQVRAEQAYCIAVEQYLHRGDQERKTA